jgi:hypothetical protein
LGKLQAVHSWLISTCVWSIAVAQAERSYIYLVNCTGKCVKWVNRAATLTKLCKSRGIAAGFLWTYV